jgi:hypothetical protein
MSAMTTILDGVSTEFAYEHEPHPTLLSLPLHIRAIITSYLDGKSLKSYSLSSQALRFEAEACLWRNVSVGKPGDDPASFDQSLAAHVEHPRRLNAIRYLHVSCEDWLLQSSPQINTEPNPDGSWSDERSESRLCVFLRLVAPHIIVLSIHAAWPVDYFPAKSFYVDLLLRPPSFPSLTHLNIEERYDPTSVIAFVLLRGTERLEWLNLTLQTHRMRDFGFGLVLGACLCIDEVSCLKCDLNAQGIELGDFASLFASLQQLPSLYGIVCDASEVWSAAERKHAMPAIVAAAIKKAANLHTVNIWPEEYDLGGDPIPRLILEHPSIQSLRWMTDTRLALHVDTFDGSLPSLEDLTIFDVCTADQFRLEVGP